MPERRFKRLDKRILLMKENDFDQRFIDTYIKHKHLLDIKEVDAFENQLKFDRTLAEEVKLQQDIAKGIHLHFENELKNKLKAAGESSSNQTKVISLKYGLLAAASISVFILMFIYLLSPDKTPLEIYTAHYTTYPNIIDPTERGDNKVDKLDAYQLYEQKDYNKAIIAFDEMINKDENNIAATFYKGLACIEEEKLEMAVISLEKVISTADTRFSTPATWYLALTHLKLDHKEKAINLFKKLKNSESSYNTRAEEVLDDI